LPLTAYAVTVPKARKQGLPFLFWVFAAIVLVGLAGYASDAGNAAKQAAADAQQSAAWNTKNDAKLKLIDPLSTPRALMARCGKPLRRDWDGWAKAPALVYKASTATIYITFLKHPKAFRADTRIGNKMYLTDQVEALHDIGCVK
jgi:hypothetical protein